MTACSLSVLATAMPPALDHVAGGVFVGMLIADQLAAAFGLGKMVFVVLDQGAAADIFKGLAFDIAAGEGAM